MDKINNLSTPATILLACVILGGFYFASQIVKQGSIERQQQVELKAQADAEQKKKEEQDWTQIQKMSCTSEAQISAMNQYENTCTWDCKEGYYYTSNYDSYYNQCLQRKGID